MFVCGGWQRDIAATICYNLAEFYQETKQVVGLFSTLVPPCCLVAHVFGDRFCLAARQDKGAAFFDEALKNNENHEKSRLVNALRHC